MSDDKKPDTKPKKEPKGSGKTYKSHMELFNELAKVPGNRGRGVVTGTGTPRGT